MSRLVAALGRDVVTSAFSRVLGLGPAPSRRLDDLLAGLDRCLDLLPLDLSAAPSSRAGRELAGLLALAARRGPDRVLLATPYDPAHRAAVAVAGLPAVLLAVDAVALQPDLAALRTHLEGAAAVLLAGSGPTGRPADPGYLSEVAALTRRSGALLVIDESAVPCWARADPPAGQRAVVAPGVVLLAGDPQGAVRSSGDPDVLAALGQLDRWYGPPPVADGAPSSAAPGRAEPAAARAALAHAWDLADRLLGGLPGYSAQPGGLGLWLHVDDAEQAAVHAWRTGSLRVLPGTYLGGPGVDGRQPGAERVFVSIDRPPEVLRDALERLVPTLVARGRLEPVGV